MQYGEYVMIVNLMISGQWKCFLSISNFTGKAGAKRMSLACYAVLPPLHVIRRRLPLVLVLLAPNTILPPNLEIRQG